MENLKPDGIVKSACELWCNSGCGIQISMQNWAPVKIDGDADNPVNRGKLCLIGKNALEYLNHPDRLRFPQKRVGPKGSGKWKQISWNEALNEIATELTGNSAKYGPKSVAFLQGCAKGYQDSYLARFANVFGSPNYSQMSYVCFHPRLRPSLITYGCLPYPDYEYPPGCIVMWGANLPATGFPENQRLLKALQKGSKLVVVDPAETTLTKKADLWIRPRPGSDLALALGVLNIIIKEKLYDNDFVEKWTTGFDKLQNHVLEYNPRKVSEITWVPEKEIYDLTYLYVKNKPASLYCGNGVENNINNFQFNRATAILRAITGNLQVPGGDITWSSAGIEPKGSPELHQRNTVSSELRSQRVGAEENILPNFFTALPQKIIKAMLTSKPYPIKCAYIQGGGLLHTYSNTKEVFLALKKLEFLAVSDFFMTPTAEMADIVLPAATFLEINSLHESEFTPTINVIQKVAQVGEAWSDCHILCELGRRIGLGNYFWKNDEEALDFLLKAKGITFNEFRKIGTITGHKQYRTYLKKGFDTPSGKVEIYSSQLEKWGFDPLPVYREPFEVQKNNVGLTQEYPLLLTNSKVSCYLHSGGRQIPGLRNSHPDPLVTLNSETAAKLGITEGDWVYIENKRGKIRQKASLSDKIDPRVVIAEHGWWYPEKETEMHGWAESNLNILTDNNPPYARELGSVTLRGISCKVYKS